MQEAYPKNRLFLGMFLVPIAGARERIHNTVFTGTGPRAIGGPAPR